MFGNGLYNSYMLNPYYQAASFSRLGSIGNAANMTGLAAKSGFGSGIGKSLLGKFSFSGFLNGASKTLNVVNQAIPIFYQVKPMINNAKTMFRIMGAVKDDSNTTNSKEINTVSTQSENIQPVKENNVIQQNIEYDNENPTFFI